MFVRPVVVVSPRHSEGLATSDHGKALRRERGRRKEVKEKKKKRSSRTNKLIFLFQKVLNRKDSERIRDEGNRCINKNSEKKQKQCNE